MKKKIKNLLPWITLVTGLLILAWELYKSFHGSKLLETRKFYDDDDEDD